LLIVEKLRGARGVWEVRGEMGRRGREKEGMKGRQEEGSRRE
jgi:hypothetical protein